MSPVQVDELVELWYPYFCAKCEDEWRDAGYCEFAAGMVATECASEHQDGLSYREWHRLIRDLERGLLARARTEGLLT